MNKIKVIFFWNLTLFIFFLLGIELISFSLLFVERKTRKITSEYETDIFVKYKNKEDSFNKNKNSKKWKLIDQNRILYRTNCEDKKYKEEIEIVISGGSTTDPLSTQHSGINGTWIDSLMNLSKEKKYCFTLYSLAYAGFDSSDELRALKYASNNLFSKDNNNQIIFVSYSGVNDIYKGEATNIKDEKFINKLNTMKFLFKTKRVLKRFKNQNDIYNNRIFKEKIQKSYLSLSEAKENSELWIRNQNQLNDYLKNKNYKYLLFLQPTIGLDQDPYTLRKKIINIEDKIKRTLLASIFDDGYFKSINLLYLNLRNKCSKYSFCLDHSFNQKLSSDVNLYSDYVHANREGNKIIANIVLDQLHIEISN